MLRVFELVIEGEEEVQGMNSVPEIIKDIRNKDIFTI